MSTSTPSAPYDDASSYRLPTTVLPHAYRLTLTPDLAAATFVGEVEIDVSVEGTTSTVVLNAAELDIASATFRHDGAEPVAPTSISLDDVEELSLIHI